MRIFFILLITFFCSHAYSFALDLEAITDTLEKVTEELSEHLKGEETQAKEEETQAKEEIKPKEKGQAKDYSKEYWYIEREEKRKAKEKRNADEKAVEDKRIAEEKRLDEEKRITEEKIKQKEVKTAEECQVKDEIKITKANPRMMSCAYKMYAILNNEPEGNRPNVNIQWVYDGKKIHVLNNKIFSSETTFNSVGYSKVEKSSPKSIKHDIKSSILCQKKGEGDAPLGPDSYKFYIDVKTEEQQWGTSTPSSSQYNFYVNFYDKTSETIIEGGKGGRYLGKCRQRELSLKDYNKRYKNK